MMRTSASLACLFLASVLPAQSRLTQFGGAIPGQVRFDIQGDPLTPYALLFSFTEHRTTIAPGVTLDIATDLVHFALELPGFAGVLNAQGRVSIPIPLPNDPEIQGTTFAMQALQLLPLGNVSNLTRFTAQARETFATTLQAALAPLVTGSAFTDADGTVLLVGGTGPVVQRYVPWLEEFEIAGVVPSGNVLATQTRLQDGRILICGGLGLAGQPVADAMVWDPITGIASSVGPMASARAGHAASLLPDGRVLVIGGAQTLDFANLPAFLAGILNTSEFFHPTTGAFTSGPNLLEQKVFHSATTLGNGEILVAGGLSVLPIVNIPIVSPTAQTYTPALGIFGFPRLMATGRMLHTAVALSNGHALLAGGLEIDFSTFLQTGDPLDLRLGSVRNAISYSPGLFGGFSGEVALAEGRILPAVAALPNQQALVAGGLVATLEPATGTFDLRPLASADLFDRARATATPVGNMVHARIGAVAHPLNDGTVLVVGGGPLEAEVFQPR